MLPLLRQRFGVLAHLLEKPRHLGVVPGVHAFEALQGFGVADAADAEIDAEGEEAFSRQSRRRERGFGERSRGRTIGGKREAKARAGCARACPVSLSARDAGTGGGGACRRDAYLSRLGSALVHHGLVSTNG